MTNNDIIHSVNVFANANRKVVRPWLKARRKQSKITEVKS